MITRQKILMRERENDATATAVAGETSPLPIPSPCPQNQVAVEKEGSISNSAKKTCKYCNLQFSSGRALGGHIRIHRKNKRRKLFFSSKKHKKRTCLHQSSEEAAIARSNNTSDKDSDGGDRNKSNNEEVTDLSHALSGGWMVQGKRGSNMKHEILIICDCQDDVDSGDDGDVDSGDDGYNDGSFNVVKRLRSTVGIFCSNSPPHFVVKRKRYICTVCNQRILTLHGVVSHICETQSSLDKSADDEEQHRPRQEEEEEGDVVVLEKDKEGKQDQNVNNEGENKKETQKSGVGEEDSVQVADLPAPAAAAAEEEEELGQQEEEEGVDVAAHQEERNNISGPMNQNVEALSVSPPRMLNIDLNELPPPED